MPKLYLTGTNIDLTQFPGALAQAETLGKDVSWLVQDGRRLILAMTKHRREDLIWDGSEFKAKRL